MIRFVSLETPAHFCCDSLGRAPLSPPTSSAPSACCLHPLHHCNVNPCTPVWDAFRIALKLAVDGFEPWPSGTVGSSPLSHYQTARSAYSLLTTPVDQLRSRPALINPRYEIPIPHFPMSPPRRGLIGFGTLGATRLSRAGTRRSTSDAPSVRARRTANDARLTYLWSSATMACPYG